MRIIPNLPVMPGGPAVESRRSEKQKQCPDFGNSCRMLPRYGEIERRATKLFWHSSAFTVLVLSETVLSTSTKKCQNLNKTMHSNATAAFLGVALSSVLVR